MITLTKLNDVFTDWLTGDGIFTDLNEFSVPWKTGEETDADLIKNLNMAYHGSHSGDKNISPIVHKFLTSEDGSAKEKPSTFTRCLVINGRNCGTLLMPNITR